MVLLSKAFNHWGVWVYYYMDRSHISNLYKNGHSMLLYKVSLYLDQVLDGVIVPNYLFRDDNSLRVTSLIDEFTEKFKPYKSINVPLLFQNDINTGLKNLQKAKSHNRHRYVLTEILEHDDYSIAMEVPLWQYKFQTKTGAKNVTGHIDLLRFKPDADKIEILDYKPEGVSVAPRVKIQVLLYRELLCRMLDLKPEDVNVGWFTNDSMYKIEFN